MAIQNRSVCMPTPSTRWIYKRARKHYWVGNIRVPLYSEILTRNRKYHFCNHLIQQRRYIFNIIYSNHSIFLRSIRFVFELHPFVLCSCEYIIRTQSQQLQQQQQLPQSQKSPQQKQQPAQSLDLDEQQKQNQEQEEKQKQNQDSVDQIEQQEQHEQLRQSWRNFSKLQQQQQLQLEQAMAAVAAVQSSGCPDHPNGKGVDCKTCELLECNFYGTDSLRMPRTPSKSPSSSNVTTSTSPPDQLPLTISPTSQPAPSFTIGACPEHVNGRPFGVECSRYTFLLLFFCVCPLSTPSTWNNNYVDQKLRRATIAITNNNQLNIKDSGKSAMGNWRPIYYYLTLSHHFRI